MLSRDDVTNWYKQQSAGGRIELMCALLDHSLPFELRFVGTVLEHLARRDYNGLRDAVYRANLLSAQNINISEKDVLLSRLAEPPVPLPNPLNHNHNNFGAANANYTYNYQNQSNDAAHRSSQSGDAKARLSGPGGGSLLSVVQQSENAQVSKTVDKGNSVNLVPGSVSNSTGSLPNSGGTSGGEEDEDSDEDMPVLCDDRRRKKLILYLSLLEATNRDSANAYYELLSEIEQFLEADGWLEGLDQSALEELCLLFTIGTHHPAFTFDQRSTMGSVLGRVRSHKTKFDVPKPAFSPVYHMQMLPPQHFETKVPVYYYSSPGLAPPGTSTSTSSTTNENVNVRSMQYFPQHSVFMSPFVGVRHAQQPNAHPYAPVGMGASIPLQPASLPSPGQLPQQMQQLSLGSSSPVSSPSVQHFSVKCQSQQLISPSGHGPLPVPQFAISPGQPPNHQILPQQLPVSVAPASVQSFSKCPPNQHLMPQQLPTSVPSASVQQFPKCPAPPQMMPISQAPMLSQNAIQSFSAKGQGHPILSPSVSSTATLAQYCNSKPSTQLMSPQQQPSVTALPSASPGSAVSSQQYSNKNTSNAPSAPQVTSAAVQFSSPKGQSSQSNQVMQSTALKAIAGQHQQFQKSAQQQQQTMPQVVSQSNSLYNSKKRATAQPTNSRPGQPTITGVSFFSSPMTGDIPTNSLDTAVPALDESVETAPRLKVSCYNCGKSTHLGSACKNPTMEEMTRNAYRLNYVPQSPNSPKSKANVEFPLYV